MPKILLNVLAAGLFLASCAHQDDPAMVAAGRSLAERHCAECHAVGAGNSPLADAPAFRDLSARFPVNRFTRAYRNGMFEGHPRMPRLDLGPDELAELSAFLSSLPR